MPLADGARPALWRLARLGYDPVRERRVLLYPEGVMLLNETGAAILELCDGARSIAEIAAALGARYGGVDVAADVRQYLDALEARELVHDAR